MTARRSLALRGEALTDLTPGDLSAVVGGVASFQDTGCTTDTVRNSYRVCSLQCQWTFNTCECAG